jgi:dCMP deaminase
MARPTWDEYFLKLIDVVGERATCDRAKSGCVIVKDKRVIATGYVGSPPGLPHCDEVGHDLRKMPDENGNIKQHCVRTIHAEQSAIVQAAKFGTSIEGSTLYVKMEPCKACAMMIISAGIKRVVCKKRYHAGDETRDLFRQAGVELEVLSDETETYENM